MKNLFARISTLFLCLTYIPFLQAQVSILTNLNEGCVPLQVSFSAEAPGASNYEWYFGNQGLSLSMNPDFTFTKAGDVLVELYAYDNLWNYLGSDELTIKVKGASDHINVSKIETCINDVVQFSLDFEASSYFWELGDGTSSTTATVSHAYAKEQDYQVAVAVETECGKDTIYDEVKVFNKLPINGDYSLSISPKIVCLEESLEISISGTPDFGYIESQSIDLGDGNIMNTTQFSHAYQKLGKYPVSATFTNFCGTDTILVDTVEVTDALSFSSGLNRDISPKIGCPNSNFSFNVYSDFKKYHWDFGDGSISNRKHVNHKYTKAGKYKVSLTVTDYCNNDSIVVDSIEVTNDLKFNGYISKEVNPKIACPSTLFRFNTYSNFLKLEWDFGDGVKSSAAYASHYYTNPGKYFVSLTVWDNCGNDSTVTDSVEVSNNLPFTGTPFINKDATDICSGASVNFNAPRGFATHYWDFGNGDISYERYCSSSFVEAGANVITLRVTDNCGIDSTITDTIWVLDQVPISKYLSYSISSKETCKLNEIYFDAGSSNIKSALWKFGDQNTSKNFSTRHQYFEEGTHPVVLELSSFCLQDTSIYDSVVISENIPISGNFSIYKSGNELCPNTSIYFSLEGSSNVNCIWNFGDGATSHSSWANHAYAASGKYAVDLTISNGCGGDTLLSDTVLIVEDKKISHISPMVISEVCPGSEVDFSVHGEDVIAAVWSFDDESIPEKSASKVFPDLGIYSYSLTAMNGCGDSLIEKLELNVVENVALNPYFTPNINQTIEQGSSAFFHFSSFESNVKSVVWDFGDGTTLDSEISSVFHQYHLPGNYLVTCEVNTHCNEKKTYSGTVFVKEMVPFGNLQLSIRNNQIVCPESPVSFQVYSDNSIKNYTWELGDGYKTNQSDFKYAYKSTGTYSAKVSLSDFFGNDTIISILVIVDDSQLIPELKIDLEDFIFCPGQLIEFKLKDNYTSVHWDFGDGSSSNASSVLYSYASKGVYDIVVTASNACGAELNYYFKIFIQDDIGENSLSMGYSSKACPGEVLHFSTSGSYDSYEWDLGNGVKVNKKSFNYVYKKEGEYDLTLTVIDFCGKKISRTEKITISSLAVDKQISLNIPSVICKNAVFNLRAFGQYTSYNWDFGDGETAEEETTTHSYSESGMYTITFIGTDYCGHPQTAIRNITVVENLPITNGSIDIPEYACPKEEISFSAYTDSYQINWLFGDGNSQIGNNVTHTYQEAGNYTIEIEVENACGDFATITRSIEIGAKDIISEGVPQAYFPQTVCLGDEALLTHYGADAFNYNVDFGDGTKASELSQTQIQGADLNYIGHTYDKEGLYSVVLEVSNGCGQTMQETYSVFVGDKGESSSFVLMNKEVDEEFCTYSVIQFFAIGGHTCEWDFGDGSAKQTTTDGVASLTHMYYETGSYTVSVLSTNSCGQKEEHELTININCDEPIATTINPNEYSGTATHFYPNPVSSLLTIELNGESDAYRSIEIINLLGRTILHHTVSGSIETIDVSKIPSGIYLLKYSTEQETILNRLIIE